MARPSLSTLDTREQYLSLLFCRAPGAASWVLISQGKVFTASPEAEEKTYRRIGDKRVKTVGGTVNVPATVTLYVDDDLVEIAQALGQPKAGGSWAGNEEIRLDPTKTRDFMVIHYDSDDPTTAIPKSVEYLNAFRPRSATKSLDADGDAEQLEIQGNAYDWYLTPVAGA